MRLIGVNLIGVNLIGVNLIGVDLISMHLMGPASPTGELWIISLNDLYAKLSLTRIRLGLNSHSKSFS
jgi:uncharacterized protein YjbI with pentapeptide repeats